MTTPYEASLAVGKGQDETDLGPPLRLFLNLVESPTRLLLPRRVYHKHQATHGYRESSDACAREPGAWWQRHPLGHSSADAPATGPRPGEALGDGEHRSTSMSTAGVVPAASHGCRRIVARASLASTLLGAHRVRRRAHAGRRLPGWRPRGVVVAGRLLRCGDRVQCLPVRRRQGTALTDAQRISAGRWRW